MPGNEKLNGQVILAVQDTTSVNYANHTKMEGLGYNCDKTLGINIHSCLAVTPEGLVLGVLDQTSYTREIRKDETSSKVIWIGLNKLYTLLSYLDFLP